MASHNLNFYWTAFPIYSEDTKGLHDLSPAGVALEENIIQAWKYHFVLHDNMLEIKCPIITPKAVLEASGHVQRFTDFLVRYTSPDGISQAFRADKILTTHLENLINESTDPQQIKEYHNAIALAESLKTPDAVANFFSKYRVVPPKPDFESLTKKAKAKAIKARLALEQKWNKEWDAAKSNGTTYSPFTYPEPFNLMFPTRIGQSNETNAFLRPETAQGIFVNFKKLLAHNGGRVPFAVAQVGKAFRNEISPKNGLIRGREFTQAEIEHFVDPENLVHPRFDAEAKAVIINWYSRKEQADEDHPNRTVSLSVGDALSTGILQNEIMAYYLSRTQQFLEFIGVDPKRIRFRQHLADEMSHYSSDCWDAEVLLKCCNGWVEIVGHADRACYDLTAHQNATSADLTAWRSFDAPKTTYSYAPTFGKTIGKVFGKNTSAFRDYIENLCTETPEKINQFITNLEQATEPITVVHHFTPPPKKGKQLPTQVVILEISKEHVSIEKVSHTITGEPFVPRVIEPSFGIGRLTECVLEHCLDTHTESDGSKPTRYVMRIPPLIAPYQCSIVLLSSNAELRKSAYQISKIMSKARISHKIDDSSVSIGKRYARTDEIGIPYGITVDFETLTENTITIRERDSMQQIRVPTVDIPKIIYPLTHGHTTWSEIYNDPKTIRFENDVSITSDNVTEQPTSTSSTTSTK